MSDRILSGHFRDDGRPKVRYETRAQADAAGDVYAKNAYPCDFCDGFHIGGRRTRSKTRTFAGAPATRATRPSLGGPRIISQPSFWERLRNRFRGLRRWVAM